MTAEHQTTLREIESEKEREIERQNEKKKERNSENSSTGSGVWRTTERGYNMHPINPHTGFTSV